MKINFFILEQIRINEFLPVDHYIVLLTSSILTLSSACGYGVQDASFTTNNAAGRAVKGLKAEKNVIIIGLAHYRIGK